jgi:hypothetical protein
MILNQFDRVPAFHTNTYTLTFRGGQSAMVYVDGDHDTDLDLYVYDQSGNLIGCDQDFTDICLVRWVPRWTGTFYVRVVNRGPVYNNYLIQAA